MPKLPSLAPRKIIKILEKKGFILDRISGSHHILPPRNEKSCYCPLVQKGVAKGNAHCYFKAGRYWQG